MARGWESKSVEAQQAEREQGRDPRAPGLSKVEIERRRRRRSLELARTRTKADLARATSSAHRSMLEAALRELDAQIAALD